MNTPEEIQALKDQWEQDPCWDIADTPGFEEHREELAAFQEHEKAAFERRYQGWLLRRSVELGIPGNTELTQYIAGLEGRIERLEEAHAG